MVLFVVIHCWEFDGGVIVGRAGFETGSTPTVPGSKGVYQRRGRAAIMIVPDSMGGGGLR